MLVLCAERTTTMLASSTVTAKALRITSAVMVADPSAIGFAPITTYRGSWLRGMRKDG